APPPSGPHPDTPPSNVVPLRPRGRAVRWLAAAAAALLVAAAVGIGAVVLSRQDDGPVTTIALTAGDLGSARGEAQVRAVPGGREVVLSVSGLPPTAPGTYYECWFVGEGDTEQQPNRVSAGTFTIGPDGTTTVTMVSAADPTRFPKMGITLEPDDGNPARTGPKYLVSAG
ncbi:MAG TPA: anti-sigma factor, partial [Pseudonocardiaceae bacterium]